MKGCAYLKIYKKYIKSFIIDFSQHLKIYIICLYDYYYKINFYNFNDIKSREYNKEL